MSKIIDEMRLQLQLDLGGQPSAGAGAGSNAFEDVMDKFIDSKDFEQALSYGGEKRRSRKVAQSGHDKQKGGATGENTMR